MYFLDNMFCKDNKYTIFALLTIKKNFGTPFFGEIYDILTMFWVQITIFIKFQTKVYDFNIDFAILLLFCGE